MIFDIGDAFKALDKIDEDVKSPKNLTLEEKELGPLVALKDDPEFKDLKDSTIRCIVRVYMQEMDIKGRVEDINIEDIRSFINDCGGLGGFLIEFYDELGKNTVIEDIVVHNPKLLDACKKVAKQEYDMGEYDDYLVKKPRKYADWEYPDMVLDVNGELNGDVLKRNANELRKIYFNSIKDDVNAFEDVDDDADDNSYNDLHAQEWMEKHPYGWYNSEDDYGTGDEDDEEGNDLDENCKLDESRSNQKAVYTVYCEASHDKEFKEDLKSCFIDDNDFHIEKVEELGEVKVDDNFNETKDGNLLMNKYKVTIICTDPDMVMFTVEEMSDILDVTNYIVFCSDIKFLTKGKKVDEKCELNEIKVDDLKKFVERIKKELPELVSETQDKLDKSENKSTDYAILSVFYSKLFGKVRDGVWTSEDVGNLFGDDQAMNPMPESVGKQLVVNLFKIKHLQPLYDLGIYDGFTLIQNFIDKPSESEYETFYNDCVKYGDDVFGNKLNEAKSAFDNLKDDPEEDAIDKMAHDMDSDEMKKLGIDESEYKMIYMFPLDFDDVLDKLPEYNLENLGKVRNFADGGCDWAIKGLKKDLERYADDHGYQLHPDYLYKEEDFDLEDSLVESKEIDLEKIAKDNHCTSYEDLTSEMYDDDIADSIKQAAECIFGGCYFSKDNTTFELHPEYIEIYVDGKSQGKFQMIYDRDLQTDRLYNYKESLNEEKLKRFEFKVWLNKNRSEDELKSLELSDPNTPHDTIMDVVAKSKEEAEDKLNYDGDVFCWDDEGVREPELLEELLSGERMDRVMGFVNGNINEFDPQELVDHIRQRHEGLHTNRVAIDNDNEKVIYYIAVTPAGWGLEQDIKWHIDIDKSTFTRKGQDTDEVEAYQWQEKQDRIMLKTVDTLEDAVKVLDDWKKTVKNEDDKKTEIGK